jgi:4-hydroxy-tetrahydrodipicolinate synthase
MMADVISALAAADETRARDLFDIYLPLVRYESQPGLGLAVRKHILAQRGAIAHPTLRKPGGGLTALAIAEVAALVTRQDQKL